MDGLRDTSLFHQACLVGGEWVTAASGRTIAVTTPETGATLGSVPSLTRPEVAGAVEAAHASFAVWSKKTASERSALIRRWYDLVEDNAADLGRILSAEQGKPWGEGIGEIHYAASFLGGSRRRRGASTATSSPPTQRTGASWSSSSRSAWRR